MKKRKEYIDAMRGVTMIFVVVCHIVNLSFKDSTMAYDDIISKFRMPLFFFVSGWVFYKAERVWNIKTVTELLKKKFMVQIIPFLVFMILYLYVYDILDISAFCGHKHGYWFTLVLFEFFVLYVVASLLLHNTSNSRKDWFMFFYALIFSCISFYYSKYYVQYAAELGHIKTMAGLLSFVKVSFFIFFWFGTFVRKYFDKFIEWTNNQYVMASVIILFVFMAVYPQVFSIAGVELLAFVLMGACGIIIVFTFFRTKEDYFKKDRLLGRSLQYVGRRTLDIYLIHYFFIPQDLTALGQTLDVYGNKIIGLVVGGVIAIFVVAVSLFVSEIIRLSPFLGHYLFGAKR